MLGLINDKHLFCFPNMTSVKLSRIQVYLASTLGATLHSKESDRVGKKSLDTWHCPLSLAGERRQQCSLI